MAKQTVTVAGDRLSLDAAQACIGQFCSAPAQRWEPDPGRSVEDRLDLDPTTLPFHSHAYRSYDCVAGSTGRTIEPIDVLVAAGLGAGLEQGAVDAVLAVLPSLNEVMAEVPEDTPAFWTMDRDLLFGDGGLWGYGGSLWTAWALLMNLKGVTILTTHAILHHKLPTLVPLLDRRTVKHFSRRSEAWKETHADLVRDAAVWDELEAWHRDTIVGRLAPGAVPLNRLRMHSLILDVRTV